MSDPREVLPGAIRQIGYVVRDLDEAMQSWCTLGVGPWYTLRDLPQPNCTYRGQRVSPTISLALTNSGPLQVELIQVLDDGPSIYREFVETGREGFHQLAWWAEDFAGLMRRADAAGWPVVFSGEAGGTHFAYFELDTTISTIIEVSELNDMTRGLATMLEAAARGWDGATDPVRSLLG
jgi:catechol 2,3-dioxygenase-like lactoylglutathione lyase family enzyme